MVERKCTITFQNSVILKKLTLQHQHCQRIASTKDDALKKMDSQHWHHKFSCDVLKR